MKRTMFLGLLLLASCDGCGQRTTSAPAPSTSVSSSKPEPPKKLDAMVLGGEHGIIDAFWTSTGEVIAVAPGELWRVRPGTTEKPKLLRLEAPVLGAGSAAKADTTMVLTADRKLHLVRGGQIKSAISVELGERRAPIVRLSDDGRVVAFGDPMLLPGATPGFELYEVEGGKHLGRVAGIEPTFDAKGALVATTSGVFDVSGQPVVKVDERTLAAPPRWVGSRVVYFDVQGVIVVDPSSKKTSRVPAPCAPVRGMLPARDVVDASQNRALRQCGDKLHVIDLEKLTPSSLKVHPPRGVIAPGNLLLARTGSRIVLEWPGVLELADPQASTVTAYDPNVAVPVGSPPIELRHPELEGVVPVLGQVAFVGAMGGTPRFGLEGCRIGESKPAPGWCEARVAPNGKGALSLDRGTLVVVDGAGKESLRLGPPPRPVARELDVPEVWPRLGGLDVYSRTGEPPPPPFRVGPPADPRTTSGFDRAKCAPKSTEARLGAQSAFVSDSEICLCHETACHPIKIPAGVTVADASGKNIVGAHDKKVVILTAGGPPRESPEVGPCASLAFTDGGETIVGLCLSATPPHRDLVELSVKDFSTIKRTTLGAPGNVPVKRGRRIPGLPGRVVAGSKGHLLTSAITAGRVDGRIVDRKTGEDMGLVHVWDTFAAVHFPDGKVELFGAPADDNVICLDGDEVFPLSACRDQVLVKDRFRFD